MALLRCYVLIVVTMFCMYNAKAQVVYYPVGSLQLLKATAQDVTMLLQQAIPCSRVTVAEYTTIPQVVLCCATIAMILLIT